jgi:hypothetical protein
MQKKISIIGRRKRKNWFVPLVAFGFVAGFVGITNADDEISKKKSMDQSTHWIPPMLPIVAMTS